ncbi:MAG: chemotaxis protein CheW [Gammaproteobacteria bacterium]|nr:chemotaxis protein CheW [Gammaproteobacteria bacterium]
MSSGETQLEVRGVLLPLQSGQLLLPNISVSEVVGYGEPEEVPKGAPDWLLGVMSWRHYRVPLVAFESLLGMPEKEIGHRARIALCNTINQASTLPYTGFLLRTIPRLVRVTEGVIVPLDEQDASPMVIRHVMVNDQEAWIPDLDALEQALVNILG